MTKVGRNDPCPCGSGLKYKKCCQDKDEEVRLESIPHQVDIEQEYQLKNAPHMWEMDEWESEDEDNTLLNQSFDEFEDEFSDEDDSDDINDFELVESLEQTSETLANTNEDAAPKFSDEDNKLADDWWDTYKNLHDTVQEREHLIAFIDKYPQLTELLVLEYEVLFELGSDHYKAGLYETYVDLLLRIRKEFPDVYRKSYAYYDSDIIFWLKANGRMDEAGQYLNWFKEEGIHEFDDKFDEFRFFLLATNHADVLLSLAETVCKKELTADIVNSTIANYLDCDMSDREIRKMMAEIQAGGVQLKQEETTIPYWRESLSEIVRPFAQWDAVLPMKRSKSMEYYSRITSNYAYYLYKYTELSFDSAMFYGYSIIEYYEKIVHEKQRPKDFFCLNTTYFEKYVLRPERWMSFANVFRITQFNALYYFAAYLETCGNLTEEQRREYQAYLVSVYPEYYQKSEKAGPEMLSFKQFPLWDIKDI